MDDVRQLHDHLAEYQVLDVREPYEWEAGHIEGAVHLPLPEVMAGRGSDVLDQGRPVVAVCHARAYATALSEDAHAATPFLVHLLTELGNQRPLDQAAHAARRTTVSTLAPDEPAIVGIPIVIRPEPRPEGEPARRPTSRP